MRTHIWAAFLLLPIASAMETERTFPFSRPVTPQELEEIAGVIRAICESRTVTPRAAPPALTVSGDEELLAVAAWLLETLEQPSKEVRRLTYRGVPDGAVRVLFLNGSQQTQNELAALVRAVTETRRLVTVAHRSALVLRGSEQQAQAAEWLADTLLNARRDRQEFRADAASNEVYRAIFLPDGTTLQSLNEAAAAIRAVGDLRKLLTFSRAGAIAIAAPAEQAALGVWLGQAVGSAPEPAPAEPLRYRYPDPVDRDTDVRVLYLSAAAPTELLNQITVRLRRETFSRRIVLVQHARAILFRGTPAQAALAEQLFKEMRR